MTRGERSTRGRPTGARSSGRGGARVSSESDRITVASSEPEDRPRRSRTPRDTEAEGAVESRRSGRGGGRGGRISSASTRQQQSTEPAKPSWASVVSKPVVVASAPAAVELQQPAVVAELAPAPVKSDRQPKQKRGEPAPVAPVEESKTVTPEPVVASSPSAANWAAVAKQPKRQQKSEPVAPVVAEQPSEPVSQPAVVPEPEPVVAATVASVPVETSSKSEEKRNKWKPRNQSPTAQVSETPAAAVSPAATVAQPASDFSDVFGTSKLEIAPSQPTSAANVSFGFQRQIAAQPSAAQPAPQLAPAVVTSPQVASQPAAPMNQPAQMFRFVFSFLFGTSTPFSCFFLDKGSAVMLIASLDVLIEHLFFVLSHLIHTSPLVQLSSIHATAS